MKMKKSYFLIRVAPGPNNALKEAAYSGLKKRRKASFFNQDCAWPKQCAKRSGLLWAEEK
jgi:hypothetical protein